MTIFRYTAINHSGAKQQGVIDAESPKLARQLLRDKNLIPFTVKITQPHKISHKALALITRQLATLLAAGLPIEAALVTISQQSEKSDIKELILSICSKIREGHTLAAALQKFPAIFSPLYCATIAAGEKASHLDKMLQQLANYTEKQITIQRKIQQALIYPVIMTLVSISIVGFLLAYVVPRMVDVYNDLNQQLPVITQLLISISSGIKNYGLYIAMSTILIITFSIRQREKIHWQLLRLPVIGNIIKTINTARFARTFAMLSSAGVSVLDAISLAAELITHPVIRTAILEAANHIREGANIHVSLKQTGYFPAMSLHLIASGETSGQLENMLERAASAQEAEVSQLLETALILFEPMIILLMGAIILFIVLAILLPIFQLDQIT